MTSSTPPTRYRREHRLEDVLVLIQALGKFNESGQVYASRLSGDDLRLRPQSLPPDSSWVEVAKEHPEFFRVSGKSDDAIMLVWQHVSKEKPTDEVLGKLMEIAVETHDRELERDQRMQERQLEASKLVIGRLKTSHRWALQNQPGDKSSLRRIVSSSRQQREASRGSRGRQ
jgi:hypothetical protein